MPDELPDDVLERVADAIGDYILEGNCFSVGGGP